MPQPSSIEVHPHPTKGRALHTTKPLPPGHVLQAFTPLLQLPSLSHLSAICTYCLTPGTPHACSRCHAAYYCNVGCQTAAWAAIHAKECKPLQRVRAHGRGHLPTPVRALLQALVKPELARALDRLQGHVEAWRRGGRWADMEMMAMGACAYAGGGSKEEDIQRAIGLLCKVGGEGDSHSVTWRWTYAIADSNECFP